MKGHWIAQVEVNDPEACQAYVAANAKAFNKFQAKSLIRGGHQARVGPAQGLLCSSSRITQRRLPATIRRNMPRQSACAARRRRPIW